MNITQKINDAPLVYAVESRTREAGPGDLDDGVDDPIDAEEVYDLIRNINDPEHPLTLEQLHVASRDHISVDDGASRVVIEFTPTIPHCSMVTLIGLCIRVRLLRSLPERFKVDIRVRHGTHQSEADVNKQLNDKERVAAALENTYLLEVVNQCLATAA
ncbi:Cytosolic iron-sulfur assembly component 2B [Coemansia javaensis]|uniref:Cytosolic iron-sulfur assembly component 2B n=1 Tax=Coemansia javaensis TaxID=2761396 RepID=A0A9W8H8I7_9FUNG|nr:Cytosolic iron-sulfur assembly component 2B [Coemansia javaensis]